MGLNCPLPVLKTKKFLAGLPVNTKIKILTTDPGSAVDLQDFCNKTGHKLITQSFENNIITTIICKQ